MRGLGGAPIEGIPVEVEVGTTTDLPPRRVGDDVDVRAAESDLVARHQLRARLAPTDVERGHDDVEAREQRVVVVEAAVDGDLQLAAVQEAESGVRALGRAALRRLAREALVQLADEAALLLDAVGRRGRWRS